MQMDHSPRPHRQFEYRFLFHIEGHLSLQIFELKRLDHSWDIDSQRNQQISSNLLLGCLSFGSPSRSRIRRKHIGGWASSISWLRATWFTYHLSFQQWKCFSKKPQPFAKHILADSTTHFSKRSLFPVTLPVKESPQQMSHLSAWWKQAVFKEECVSF